MRERDIRRLVIVDEQGRLAGIVTERDVLAYAHPLLRYAYHLVKKGAGRRAF
jgi:CBS domain-containing protein